MLALARGLLRGQSPLAAPGHGRERCPAAGDTNGYESDGFKRLVEWMSSGGGITAPRGSEKIDLALVSSSYRSPQKTRQHRRGP